MKENIIQVKNIVKKYNLYSKPQDRFKEAIGIKKKKLHNEFFALNDITFDVKKGETVGIVGTNGSGKSTLLKIITGVLSPTGGSVQVKGKISALLELGAGFNQEYTGMENIYLNGRMMGYSRKEMEKRVDDIVDFAELGNFIHQPVKTYSSGMFARLAFAVAINVEPDILIVDEALSVGDLFFQNKCFKKFEELKQKDITILFVSHDISSVRQMCSRVLWIEKGKQVVFDQSDKVCDMYMDMKRMGMNEQLSMDKENSEKHFKSVECNKSVQFPKVSYKESAILSDKIEIKSVFATDKNEKVSNSFIVEEAYTFHIVAQLKEDLDNLIFGIVVENNKGIPLYDFNNYINDGKVMRGKKGEFVEVTFKFVLPRIMKGTYILSAAIAQGTQEKHMMLTWLHGVGELEIINQGYNSSYIEIPADICQVTHNQELVKII